MKKVMMMVAAAVAAVVITGCTTTPQNFTYASKPVDQGRYTVLGEEVEGTDTQVSVLGFGVGLPGSPQRRALKKALDKSAGADALVGMAVDYQTINLWWVYVLTTRVTGTPVKTNNSAK
jgi:hypothetical protein